MPDINDGVSDRLALIIFNLTMQPHHFPGISAIIHPGVAVGQRRIGHIQRPFDGARGTGFPPRRRINGVLTQVEEMLQSQPGRQQRRFLTPTQLVQIVHRVPELFFCDVIVIDQRTDILQQTVDDGFKTFITARDI